MSKPQGGPAEQLPLQLDHCSGVPLHRQLTDQLAMLIRAGEIKQNGPLPPMRLLAEQLAVSLITVRRSYGDLEAMGLVVRRRGRGTRVVEDVRTIALEQAATEVRAQLSAAIDMATRIGLDYATLRAIFEVLLDRRKSKQSNPESVQPPSGS